MLGCGNILRYCKMVQEVYNILFFEILGVIQLMETDKPNNPSAIVFFSAIAIITPADFSFYFVDEFHTYRSCIPGYYMYDLKNGDSLHKNVLFTLLSDKPLKPDVAEY